MQINSLGGNTLDFLHAHYDVIYQSEGLQSLDEANTFFIPDSLPESGHITINNLFIDTFDESTSVYISEYPSLIPVEDPMRCLQTYQLAKKKAVYGWDIGAPVEILGADDNLKTKYAQMKIAEGNVCKLARTLSKDFANIMQSRTEAQLTLQKKLWEVAPYLMRNTTQLTIHLLTDRYDSLIRTLEKTNDSAKKQKRCMIIPVAYLYEKNCTLVIDKLASELKLLANQRIEKPVDSLREYLNDKKAVILSPKPPTPAF